ncbi:MAG: hypothetical protein RSB76_02770 [Clostridia bacterium]
MNCIACLNDRINNLEKQMCCLINIINSTESSNILVGYVEPLCNKCRNGTIYIQLKGGVFYKAYNNKWNIIGTLEPLIVDGGESLWYKGGINKCQHKSN